MKLMEETLKAKFDEEISKDSARSGDINPIPVVAKTNKLTSQIYDSKKSGGSSLEDIELNWLNWNNALLLKIKFISLIISNGHNYSNPTIDYLDSYCFETNCVSIGYDLQV